ncbi:MAG: ATP-binding protein [Acidimicrobiales bacterium]
MKLYDKVSAVVAELVANGYDADASTVSVRVPLAVALATRDQAGNVKDRGYLIEVSDDGHGMTPNEARRYFLEVGRDRRQDPAQGPISPGGRAVMGRKGIGKLAPFGICRRIEVLSSGATRAPDGYVTSHFWLDYDDIMNSRDDRVPLQRGDQDGRYRPNRGTLIRLSAFHPKRVPDRETFSRQLARRFALAEAGFSIEVIDLTVEADDPDRSFAVPSFAVETLENARIDVDRRPVTGPDDKALPVRGWLGLAKQAYQNEEMAGVRIYARGKIVATTRDFELPAGFTGEFTIRSYLVGEIHAEWLDADDG